MRRTHVYLMVSMAALLIIISFLSGCATQEGGGHIVFESREGDTADIYIMNADGTELTPLVSDPAWDGTPALSPDGTRLAFASDRNGNPEIYVMDIDGSNLVQLTDNDATDIMPAWSPDGTRIAFVSDRIYKKPLEGGSLEIIAGMELYVMNSDGSEVERLSENQNDISLYPSWSPDGTHIVYMNLGDAAGSLYIVDLAAIDEEPFDVTSATDLIAWNPEWSPDGKHIAFMGDHETEKDVFRIDADGKNLVNLTIDREGLNGDPSWSLDGELIVFASSLEEGGVNLYVMTKDGKDIAPLTTGEGQYVQSHWSK